MRTTGRLRTAAAVAVDAVVYGAVVTALVFVGSTLASFASGGDWVTVKAVLFVVGTLVLGYGTARLWLAAPYWQDDAEETGSLTGSAAIPKRGGTRFQRFVERVPPRRWVDLTPREAVSPASKLLVAGLMIMAVSFVMEAAFGIGA
ncbi:DUF7555 family protein [Salinilacihabitans rarus]|uniref:DUF7555 family protein n=1 Tax=Salinilacihabitans rarus TaxID=2961596 RepID=UPI0020C8423F|nr:hypothetical protein [Salinilacihabitans rarus]